MFNNNIYLYKSRCKLQVIQSKYVNKNGERIGRGLVTINPIELGEHIIDFQGEVTNINVHDNYTIRLKKDNYLSCKSNAFSVPIKCIASMANTANHLICPVTGKMLSSKDNNCQLVVRGNGAYLIASRNIEANEELFFPYNFKL